METKDDIRTKLTDIANLVGFDYEIVFNRYLYILPQESQEESHLGLIVNEHGEVIEEGIKSLHAIINSTPDTRDINGYIILDKTIEEYRSKQNKSCMSKVSKRHSGLYRNCEIYTYDKEINLLDRGSSLTEALGMMGLKFKVKVLVSGGGIDYANVVLSEKSFMVQFKNLTYSSVILYGTRLNDLYSHQIPTGRLNILNGDK